MRKLRLITLIAILGTTGLFASEKIEMNNNSEIRNQLVSLLDKAKFETVEDFTIEFTFTFNSQGEIVVLSLNSVRSDVKEFVREHINYKKIENPGLKDMIYTMPVKVKAS